MFIQCRGTCINLLFNGHLFKKFLATAIETTTQKKMNIIKQKECSSRPSSRNICSLKLFPHLEKSCFQWSKWSSAINRSFKIIFCNESYIKVFILNGYHFSLWLFYSHNTIRNISFFQEKWKMLLGCQCSEQIFGPILYCTPHSYIFIATLNCFFITLQNAKKID